MSKKKTNVHSYKTHDILQKLWNLWYFTKIMKLIIFYWGTETHMIFYGDYKTYDILRIWYFTRFETMTFYEGYKIHGS